MLDGWRKCQSFSRTRLIAGFASQSRAAKLLASLILWFIIHSHNHIISDGYDTNNAVYPDQRKTPKVN